MSNFSSFSSNHGGSYIFVWKDWRTKEVKNCKWTRSWKGFEMTTVELLDFKFTLACIYRSLDRDFYDFLTKLGSVICKVQSKGKQFYVVTGILISLKTMQNFKNYKICFLHIIW